jgi:hypothetical protein
MARLKGAEEALASLIGAETIVPSSQYPDAITLPSGIYDRALQAIDATVDNGREQSINFNYRNGQWLGGRMLRGTKMQMSREGAIWIGANRLHGLTTPHVHMHTHTGSPSGSLIDRSIAIRSAKENWDDQQINIEKAKYVLGWAAGTPLPSIRDISKTSTDLLGGSVADLISSSEGHFLWVRNDIYVNRSYGSLSGRLPPRKLGKLIDTSKEIFAELHSVEETRRALLLAEVAVLGYNYTCYFSEDPQSPHIPRVQ